jgi:hypothetical protein
MHAIVRSAVLVFTLATSIGVARADWGYGYVPNPYATQNYYAAFGYGRRGADANQEVAEERQRAQRSLKATDFKRTGRPLLDEYLAESGAEGEALDQLRSVMESELDAFESAVRKNNVAAATGVLYAVAYEAVNDISIGDAERDDVIARVNDVLAADAKFKKSKAKARQELADTMLIHAVLIKVMRSVDDPSARAIAEKAGRASLLALTGSETAGYEPIIEIPSDQP